MNEKKLWFRRKRYGWGWVPSSWEGYLALLVYFVLLVGASFLTNKNSLHFVIYFVILTTVLIYVSYKKGEKVDWTKFKQY